MWDILCAESVSGCTVFLEGKIILELHRLQFDCTQMENEYSEIYKNGIKTTKKKVIVTNWELFIKTKLLYESRFKKYLPLTRTPNVSQ